MKKILVTLTTVLFLLPAFAASHPEPWQQREELNFERRVASKEVKLSDNQMIAKQTGFTVDEVTAHMDFAEHFEAFLAKIEMAYADQISYSFMEEMPHKTGVLCFVNNVPDLISEWVKGDPNLAETVVLLGNGLIPYAEHVKRAEEASLALVDLGHENHFSFFEPKSEKIRLEIQVPSAKMKSFDAQLVLEAIAKRFKTRQGFSKTVARVSADDLDIMLLDDSEPLAEQMANLQGGRSLSGLAGICSIGFSASSFYGQGIISAGHCALTNRARNDQGTLSNVYLYTAVNGTGGDAAFFRSNTYAKNEIIYRFNPNKWPTERIRQIRSAGDAPVGATVNTYLHRNRVTGTHTVLARNVVWNARTSSGGTIRLTKMVRTNNQLAVAGDSGSSVFSYSTARGVLATSGRGYHHYTPVSAIQSALGVWIKTN